MSEGSIYITPRWPGRERERAGWRGSGVLTRRHGVGDLNSHYLLSVLLWRNIRSVQSMQTKAAPLAGKDRASVGPRPR